MSNLSKTEYYILRLFSIVNKDIWVGTAIFGWEWERDHFHTDDSRVVRRTDYK